MSSESELAALRHCLDHAALDPRCEACAWHNEKVEEVLSALRRSTSVAEPERCPNCDARGWYEVIGNAHDPRCDGTCSVGCPVPVQEQEQCAACEGTGVALTRAGLELVLGCAVDPLSSRCCERGTKCCVVKHGAPPTEPKVKHVCGLQGFGLDPGDTCPACAGRAEEKPAMADHRRPTDPALRVTATAPPTRPR